MKRLTNHDLYSLKQRFAQLTTFKCHPTAKSAYQRQAMHSDEDVCGGIIFLPHRFHPSPKKAIKYPRSVNAFGRERNINVNISCAEILLLLINLLPFWKLD